MTHTPATPPMLARLRLQQSHDTPTTPQTVERSLIAVSSPDGGPAGARLPLQFKRCRAVGACGPKTGSTVTVTNRRKLHRRADTTALSRGAAHADPASFKEN